MKTEQLLTILGNSETFEINKLKPRAYKQTYDLNGNSKELSLNGDWDFEFYPLIQERNPDFFKESVTLNKTIKVPSHIELNGYGQIQYVNVCYPWDGHQNINVGDLPQDISVGQYKRTFEYESNLESFKQFICFEGVEQAFNLWINGKYIGYSEDSFTEAEFDITEYLQNGSNTVAVEVYQYTSSSWLEGQDFWRFFGIFRDVLLKEVSKSSIVDFDLKYDLNVNNQSAAVMINSELTNKDSEYKLNIYDGLSLLKTVKLNEFTKVELSNIDLWTCETPKLYQFEFISENEKFVHNVGFRKIEIIDKVLCINGKRLVFKGINRHEFNCETGRTINREAIKKDVELIKHNNFNAIRTSHYPNHPYFYQLCDQLGLYVIDEANLETHGTWLDGIGNVTADTALPDNNSKYRANIMFRMENMYERDKNFTSIIAWSLGNESYGGKILFEASEYFRKVDSSRFVHYEGITWDRRYNDSSDIESRMYTRTDELIDLLEAGMEKPIIMCEYSHAMGNSNGNITDYLQLETKYDMYQGGFIWEYMDQTLKVDGVYNYGGDFDDRPTDYDFICDGLFGPDREIKPDTEYVALQFSPIDINETENEIYITSKLQFAPLELSLTLSEYVQNQFELYDNNKITIGAGQSIKLAKVDNKFIKLDFYSPNYKLQSYSYGQKFFNKQVIKVHDFPINFVDTPFYFSVKDNDNHIMFSKANNNIVSIKYNGIELFENIESGFKPGFWRAPTSNDKGANKHRELSIWNTISEYSTSKITDYKVVKNQLIVNVEFTYDLFKEYKSIIKYVINSDCSFDLQFNTTLPSNLVAPFCAGITSHLKSEHLISQYLGNGPFDSYSDRKEAMDKSIHMFKMTDGYFVPQEFGNKTNVDYVNFVTNNKSLFTITATDQFELNYKKYSDIKLEAANHRYQLTSNSNQLKINAYVAGVGGDDSWMTWCKDEYQLIPGNKYQLNIHVGRA